MYDCFNEGVAYLKERLGTREVRSGINIKNSPNRIDSVYRNEIIVPLSEEHNIHLLLTQYYYGIEVKRELYYKLIELGVLKE